MSKHRPGSEAWKAQQANNEFVADHGNDPDAICRMILNQFSRSYEQRHQSAREKRGQAESYHPEDWQPLPTAVVADTSGISSFEEWLKLLTKWCLVPATLQAMGTDSTYDVCFLLRISETAPWETSIQCIHQSIVDKIAGSESVPENSRELSDEQDPTPEETTFVYRVGMIAQPGNRQQRASTSGTCIPIHFFHNQDTKAVLVFNQMQLAQPEEFIVFGCDCTTSLLNFVGALDALYQGKDHGLNTFVQTHQRIMDAYREIKHGPVYEGLTIAGKECMQIFENGWNEKQIEILKDDPEVWRMK